jgi:glyoxylase-like metal-dependent hydrolase (beta-lactamase superfamily II)
MKYSTNIELIDGTMANCYIVRKSEKNILIDAGMKGSAKKIIEHFRETGEKPDIILITHCHIDHIGGLYDIESHFHPLIYVPDKEVAIAKGVEKMSSAGGFASMFTGMVKARPVVSVRNLSELKLEGMSTVDTKGHTPGSTSCYFGELKAIFVGDSIYEKEGEFGFNKSFTLDQKNAEISMKKILEMHGITAYPGHGKPFEIP